MIGMATKTNLWTTLVDKPPGDIGVLAAVGEFGRLSGPEQRTGIEELFAEATGFLEDKISFLVATKSHAPAYISQRAKLETVLSTLPYLATSIEAHHRAITLIHKLQIFAQNKLKDDVLARHCELVGNELADTFAKTISRAFYPEGYAHPETATTFFAPNGTIHEHRTTLGMHPRG